MARRGASFTQLLMDSMDSAQRGFSQAGQNLMEQKRLAQDAEESKVRMGLVAEQIRGAKADSDTKALSYQDLLREDSLKKSLESAAGARSKALEGTPTATGHAVDFQAAKKIGGDFRQADAALWNKLNPGNPMTADQLAEKREQADAQGEAERNLIETIGEDAELGETEKAYYRANPKAYGDKLKPTPVTYLPGADGYVAAPTRGGGPVKKVVDETGGAVKPQPRPAEKTTKQIEEEAAARARGTASAAPEKPLSGDAAKLSGVVSTLRSQAAKLRKIVEEQGIRTVVAKYKAGDPNVVNIVDDVADAKGRLRSGGAVNKDEEERFKKPFAGVGNLIFNDNEAALAAIDAALNEATTVEKGMTKGTAGQSGSGDVPVGTVKTNKQGMKVRKTATGWEPAE